MSLIIKREEAQPSDLTIDYAYTIDVIALDGSLAHRLVIAIHKTSSGTWPLSVSGSIGDVKLAEEILDNARDAVGAYHTTRSNLVVPGKDVTIGDVAVREVRIEGPIDNREYTLACIESGRAALRDYHARRAAIAGRQLAVL